MQKIDEISGDQIVTEMDHENETTAPAHYRGSRLATAPTVLKQLEMDVPLTFLKDCTSVVRSHSDSSNNLLLSTLSGQVTSPKENSMIHDLVKNTPNNLLMIAFLLVATLIGIIAYTSLFSNILLIVGIFVVIGFGLHFFFSSREQENKTVQEIRKQQMALQAQTFSNQAILAVQNITQRLNSFNLETLKLGSQLAASAKLAEISRIEGMHTQEVSKDVKVNQTVQEGLTRRTRLTCDTDLTATNQKVQVESKIANLDSETVKKANQAKQALAQSKMSNNSFIAEKECSTALKVAEAESRRVLAQKEKEMAEERKRIEEYRRQNGV